MVEEIKEVGQGEAVSMMQLGEEEQVAINTEGGAASAMAEFVAEEENQNVIYVNSESDLFQLAQEVYSGGGGGDGGEPQYVYIQEDGGNVLHQLVQ